MYTDWVELDFVADRLNVGVAKQICHHLQVEVRYTDAFGKSGLDELLQLLPQNVNRHAVAHIRLEITSRPMNQVQVCVPAAKLLKRKP